MTDWYPEYVDGFCINGCLPQDADSEELEASLVSSAVPINLWLNYDSDEMPFVKCDSAFEEWLEEQGKIADELRNGRIQNILPWDVLRALTPLHKQSDRLYFSQGSMPSCMGHADAFAMHSSTLTGISRGLPLVYESFNPIVTWAISKGGSTRGGQNVTTMAKFSNSHGQFPESLVGRNNLQVPNYMPFTREALNYRTGIIFLSAGSGAPLARQIARCCRAGLGVACGNSTAVRGSMRDSNGIKVAVIGGSWGHATSFTGYRVVNGEEYVFWVNSHGPRYGTSGEGEPADGAWMRVEKELAQFCTTMARYGAPYTVLPRALTVSGSYVAKTRVPFPDAWRG
jgi:hypothetical protein